MKKLVIALGLILAVALSSLFAQEKRAEKKDVKKKKEEKKEEISPELKKKIEGLIKKLGDENYKVREKATNELMDITKKNPNVVMPYLEKATKSKDLEVQMRVKKLLGFAKLEIKLKEKNLPHFDELLTSKQTLNGLHFMIKTDKKVYLLNEPVKIKFIWINLKGTDVLIEKIYWGCPAPALKIFNLESNKKVEYKGICISPERTLYIKIPQYDILEKEFLVNKSSGFHLNKAGKYEFHRTYHSYCPKQRKDVWEGVIKAKPIKIEVLPYTKKKIESLIKKLGSEKFKEREEATKELIKIGEPAIEPLKKVLKETKDAEVQMRAKKILYEIDWPEGGKVIKGLQAVIKSNKKVYKLGEKITIEFRVKNVSNKDIYIGTKYPRLGTCDFIGFHEIIGPGPPLDDSPREISRSIQPPLPLTKNDFALIKPQKTYSKEIKGSATSRGFAYWRTVTVTRSYPLDRPGKYKITMLYKSNADGTKAGLEVNAWTGKVLSNTITIEIVTEEELKKREELKKNIESLIKKLGSEKLKEREEATKELIKIGKPAIEPLKKVLKETKDAEVQMRAKKILWEIDWPEGGKVVKGLQAIIKSDKKIYKLEERIIIECRLTNVSDKKMSILTPSPPLAPGIKSTVVWFDKIIGPEGEIKPKTLCIEYSSPPLKKSDFTLIKPDNCYRKKIKGSAKSSGLSCGTPCRIDFYHLDKPGEYKITMSYENKNDGKKFGLNAWTGKVLSNTITIEITK